MREYGRCGRPPGSGIILLMGTLLAIDGLINIVRRVYEAIPEHDSPEKAEAALRNSYASFRRLLDTHAPTHAVAAFDFGGPTWRNLLYPAYRGKRAHMPHDLHEQLPDFREKVQHLQLATISVPGAEAVDVIGTVVMRWLAEGRGDAIVSSTDKHLLPLL